MPKHLWLFLIITLFAGCKGCGTGKSETQTALGVSLDASSTKDSTYSVTHDSTFHKVVPNVVKVPYDTTISIKSTIDSVVHHDSLAHYNKPITGTSKVPSVIKTTHDTTKVTTTTNKLRTTHDSFYCRKNFIFFNSCKNRSVTHDTTTYTNTYTKSSVTHDTTVYTIKTDTIGYVIKDTIVKAIHDTTLPITVQYHETRYKDSTVYLDVFYTAPTTHDTTVSVTIVPPPDTIKTVFGGKLQGDNPTTTITVARDSLHYKLIRPTSIAVDTYTGTPSNLKKYSDAGLWCVQNVSYTSTSGNNVVPYLPYSDTTAYKIKLEQLCRDNAQYIKILVIENEPINTQFYSGNFQNYIAELRMSVEIGHKYGIKVVSGCVHVELVEAVRTGQTGDTRITNTKTLMDAEKTIPVDYTNIHDQWNNGSYSVPNWTTTVNWLSSYTGHSVMANEISSQNATPQIWTQYMDWAKQCKMPYFMFWSGDLFNGVMLPNSNSKGDATNNSLLLSNIGKAVQGYLK